MEPEASTSEQHPSLFQGINEGWTTVTLRENPATLPENERGIAQWTNMHNEDMYTFYVKVNNLYYVVEFINKTWFQLTYNENMKVFFIKADQALTRSDPAHPFHTGKGIDTAGISVGEVRSQTDPNSV